MPGSGGYPPPPGAGYPAPPPGAYPPPSQGGPGYPPPPQGGPPPYGRPGGGPYQQPPPPHRRPGPPGPYGGPPYPPPRYHQGNRRGKGSGLAVVAGILGGIAGLFVLFIVIAALVNSVGDDSTSPIALPTYTPPSADDTDRPTRKPTRSSTREENDDSRQQQTQTRRPAANRSLRNNSVYRAGALAKVDCPGGSASIYDHAQLKALILKTSRCLDKVWSPVLEGQGIDWHRPGYAIASRAGRGACGDYPSPGSIVPYYCPRNTTIYASTSAMSRGSGSSQGYGQATPWHGAIISMMAHEYGHHVQQLSGLGDSYWRQSLDSSSSSGRLALSRRFELQATCFAGMFMRAASATYPVPASRRQILYYFHSRVGDWPGRPRDHGSPPNNGRWFRQGYEKNKAYQCNTWLAPSNTTS
ncbi:neutral zinc metallopeptidase [Spongiactinospora sp. TRM90649]|uniref:neutral zinc metallopeptidase n=1 Tax=Spongiactinospora sp. TRM90649 TaxID=3031114 RepID=UPI0023F6EB86|nr:neutral zinc metallopeptidase [Spongiactinospora sp. TRM90649]MDF5753903.1 neutral zinc metallopeptidase [Spongiactinospora sp. TRM90649]